MIFKIYKHDTDLYNKLLILSRNIFFYKKIKLADTFETRIYLMFVHFSIFMIVFKKKKIKFSQSDYDSLFNNIENDLRELGFGDISVNKKMKELNKIMYDILLKIESKEKNLNNNILLSPKIDSLIDILNSIINKSDDKKETRSKLVRENFSWENVVKKLKKEFEKKLSK